MGMFDWVTCDCDLPGEPLKILDNTFQTKSLENFLKYYNVSKDRTFSEDITKEITIYNNNISMVSCHGSFVMNADYLENVEYKLEIFKGKVLTIKQIKYSIEPSLTSAEFRKNKKEYISPSSINENSDIVGETLFLRYGLYDHPIQKYIEITKCEDDKIFYKSIKDKEACVYKSQIGSTIFKDEKDADLCKEARKKFLKEEEQRYEQLLQEKIVSKNLTYHNK